MGLRNISHPEERAKRLSRRRQGTASMLSPTVSWRSMADRLFGSELALRDYFPLLRWMILTGVSLFGGAVAWHYGLFALMAAQDRSRISVSICVLYVGISAHCLFSIINISREINTAHRVRHRIMSGVNAYRLEGRRVVTDDGGALPAGRVTDYIHNLVV